MNEHPIWRPNCFNPEQWHELTRGQQIQWYRDHAPERRANPDPLRIVAAYRDGAYTEAGLPLTVFASLTEENILRFLADCPADVLRLLRREADALPPDDDEQAWAGIILLAPGVCAPWLTAEEIQEAENLQRCQFRLGVKLFRANLRVTDP